MDADRTPTRGASRRMLLAVAAAAIVTGVTAVALSTERRPAPPPAIATGVAKRPLSATSGLRPRRASPVAGCHPTCRGGERADPGPALRRDMPMRDPTYPVADTPDGIARFLDTLSTVPFPSPSAAG